MYLRPVHTDLNLPTLYNFIRKNPLGIFTTAIQSPDYPLLQSSHIPWVLDVPANASSPDGAAFGKLRGHIARVNPQTKALIESITQSQSTNDKPQGRNGTLTEEAMIFFNGLVYYYVTLKFYTETKPTTGKVVPTWNYSAVQAYGTARIFFDTSSPETVAFLAQQIDDLSKQSEEEIMGYTGQNGKPSAWTVAEAPEKYTDLLKKAIVGIEIELTALAGKFKMS